jgi:hypothetical protein
MRRRCLVASGSCCLAGFTGLASGCVSTANWFGASEGGIEDWEIERISREIDTGELADSIRGPMETRVKRILLTLSAAEQAKLSNIDIRVLKAPQGLFVFESGFDLEEVPPIPLIRTSSASVAGLQKVCMAQSVGTLVDNDGTWLNRYLLYIRSTPAGDPIVDPLRASGILGGEQNPVTNIEKSKFDLIWKNAQIVFDIMLTFLLAHEIAHLALPRKSQGSLESLEAYNDRVRIDESRADREALKMLAAVEATQNGSTKNVPLYLTGAPMVFLQWIVTMEGAQRSLHPRTHPLDHKRALAAVLEIEKMIGELPLTDSERIRLPALIAETREEVAIIERRGVAAYFADLDRQAREVTLASLRFIPPQ